jgi:protein-L-isoaspartate(D-aspartate) O-methyltransferase
VDEATAAALRAGMVREQLAAQGIRNRRVLASMGAVPRHRFVPDDVAERAYENCPLPIGLGQTISQPYMVALMTELIEPGPADSVLEIGTGSGYQAAVLSPLVDQVVSIERHPELARAAAARLAELGCRNVRVELGDGTLGAPGAAPFDAILVTAGGPRPPAQLVRQLADGGRLLCPVGDRATQRLVLLRRRGNTVVPEEGTRCVFVPLIGADAWEDEGPR